MDLNTNDCKTLVLPEPPHTFDAIPRNILMTTLLRQQNWMNPAIGECRERALALLKPTDQELDKGFALHEDATVVEPYGFSAFAAPDMRAIEAAIAAGAGPQEIARRRLRDAMTRMADDPEQARFFREAWEAAGVTCVVRNSGEEGNQPLRMLERLSYNNYVLDRMSDFLVRAISADDIRRAKQTGKRAFLFQTNGVPLLQNADSLYDELRLIRVFCDLGVRSMHLTYNRRNAIADGNAETNDGGLSDFGRDVVAEMNRVGVIVDVAHSSPRTCRDAAACSSRPIMISHATCRGLNQHRRAQPDDAIKAVADTGGLIGICCMPNFLGGTGDIIAMLDHIDYAVKLVGAEHVAIAPDLGATAPGFVQTVPNAPPPPRGFEHYVAADNPSPYTEAQQYELVETMAWTNWPLFTVGLVQRGYSEKQIRCILGENVLRVLDEALTE